VGEGGSDWQVKMADTRIILIRHGETEWNRDGRFLGWRESDLTELGRQQAGALALALRNTPLSAIYSSPSQRTVITAQAINVHHGLEIHTDPRLRELNQGQVEGLTASQIRARFPGLLERLNTDLTSVHLPGGETFDELQDRAWAALRDVMGAHPTSIVAVVAHMWTIKVIVARILGAPLSATWHFTVAPGSLTIIGYEWGRLSVLNLNDTHHLACCALRAACWNGTRTT